MRCPSCQGDNPEQARRCALCGASLSGVSEPPPVPSLELMVAERREATLLFADLGGYTELTRQSDVEDVAAVMDAIKDGAAEIVRTYGGVVNQFVGDEVVAVFGLPYGHEDDPRRAVSAALELHAFVRSSRVARLLGGRPGLALHTGIDTGLVLAQSRDLRDGLFHLTGHAVNFAARLRTLARPDEILLGETTQRRVAPFFRTTSLPQQQIKGVAEPVTPHRVEAHGAARSSFDVSVERGLTPYVGRRLELATLENHLAEAGRGQARVVSLVGPPGVGKTRLVHELCTRASQRGFTILRGRCQSYGIIPPFQPFLDTLRDAVDLPRAGPDAAAHVITRVLEIDRELGVHLPVFLYLLGLASASHALPETLRGPLLRRAVSAALADLLLALARKQPLLVVVEDWHWADEASDSLFRDLARATRGRTIMALVTYRSDQLGERRPLSHHRIQLAHFGELGSASFLRELLQSDALPQELVRYVHAVTEGNAFFIEEIRHALTDSGALVRAGTSWLLTRSLAELSTPSSVHAMVQARVDRLDLSDKELLKLASVVGSEFMLDLLEPIAHQTGELHTGLSRLETRAHIQQLTPLSYRFKHLIVHEVVYNVLLIKRRRELHGSIAQLIEARAAGNSLEPYYEALAHHYGRSEARSRAVLYAELAARKAERSFSLDQARRQYALAIDCLDELTQTPENMRHRIDLSVRWAAAHVHNPAASQAPVLERSLEYAERLGDSRATARCLCWLGWVQYTYGHPQRALAYNQQALALLDAERDRRLVEQVENNLGVASVMATRYEDAQRYLARVAAHPALEEGSGSAADTGYGLAHLALLAADRGDFGLAAIQLDQARAAIDVSGRYALGGALGVIEGMVCVMRGDWPAVQVCALRVREVAERIDGAYQRCMATALEGLARFHAAGEREALLRVRGAASGLETRGMGLALSWLLAALAEALWLAEEPDAAGMYANLALHRAEQGDALGEATAYRVRALARAAQGQLGAQEDFAASLTVASRKQSAREELLTRWASAVLRGEKRDDFAARFSALHMDWHAERVRV
jgi:class 3 adenylate cyclase